ncbi:hypothetical protein PPERSA_01494 [Pseudocohnilembus persalinus]|uniref:Uncharacterized protein n=1 Tax=Pseudocohnilembus persalinus TaxID=266149 RepID=A0A0V0QHB0_PSEPJ|nr:hypothetical protein PPERSA_01494 [Pseudocohnilembus persalinus]|eukprot:KRX01591.1 hypothetical protein PPERSA_01494 [Pseudocohnilembus persalinus]
MYYKKEKEMEQREQEAIFDNYEDTFVNSWLKFLLCSQQATINTKIEKDMSVLEERANQISQEKLPDAYFEFYKRLLKLIFLKSRDSMIKILSYLNFFRCTQKNLNLVYTEMVLNKNIEGSQIDIIKSKFDVNKPIDQHEENPVKDDTFLLTNPAMAHYGNLSNYLFKQKVLDESKEDLIREKGNVKPSNYQEPGILYEEEKIHFIQDKQIIEIYDHNNNKIVYDASVHDFLEILNEVGEICAFFFRFNLKHEQQEQGNKDIFKDNFDRETLIDSILELEQKFQYEKAQLIQTLTKINKSCFTPDLKKSLIELIAKYMTKRPRMDLFEQNVFKCYHYEIENLQIQNEIYKKTLEDLIQEEKQLYQLKVSINQQAKDKFDDFYYSIQNSNVINVQFYMKSLVKLILNVEQNKQSFDDLIPSTRGSPKKLTSEILKCENDYFKKLLMYTKQIINDCEGMNIFPDYNEFKFIETDQVLDRPENFNLVQSQIKIQVEEKSSEQEQKEFDFDSFSILEFQKVRKKMMNFLFAFSFLMEIYEQQLSILGEDYVQKFQLNHKIGENQQITRKPNYCVGLLDHDKVKIFKEIKELKDWQSTIVQKQKIEDFLIPLESLIILKLMLVSNIVQNNILFDQIKEQYSQNTDEYQDILQISGAKNFANIFTIKEKFSRKAQKTKTKQDQIWKEKLEKLGIMNTFDHETENKKNKKKKGLLPYFSIKLRRELQFQNIKIQTLLQRINLEKLHRKLPFIEHMLEFQNIKQPNIKSAQFNLKQDENNNINYLQVNPASAQYNKVKNTQSDSDNDSENDCMEEQCQFFDSFQSINDIFSLPSVENIISFKHGDFAKILRKYDIQTEEDRNFHKIPKPNKPGEFYEDDNFTMQQSQQDSENQKDELQWNISNQVGGSEWYKLQELKQDKGECLWLSNKAVFQTKYKNQRGFRPRPSFKEKSLLYLKKNSIFNLWTIQNQLTDILTLQIFLVSLEANAMDMILFHNGLLSSADLEIKDKKLTSNKHKTFLDVIHKPLEIPVLKRNELRLRRDLEPLKKLIENLKQNVQWIKKNQNKFIQTDEAIVAYLDKVETRLFLTILHVLLEQMNISRQKQDNEFLHKMRYMLINLNFQQIKCLARSDTDKNIVLQKTVELDDVIEYFPNIPDKILYDNSSDFMKVIQTIFWDNRPKLRQNIHSTNINMQVTRSFFNEQLKTCQVLDRALVGLQQSNATELSTTYARIKQIQNDFLRSIFIFEQDDIFKFERMYTKLIKFFIRYNISKEVYYVRKLKIFPFEVIQNDPLKEKLELWDQKIQKELKGQNQKTIQSQPTLSSKKLEGFQEQEGPEKLVMRKLNAMIFEINKLLMEESLEFYNMKNLQYAKFLQENPSFQFDTTLSTLQYDQLKILPQQANLFNNQQLCLTDENYVQLDLISLLSTFCNQIHFGSIEIETLNQGSAIVIPKDNLKSHLSELNNHLVQLMDKKYKQKVKFLEQKAKILQQDVEFQKKQQVLQEKKIIFLEQNTLNLTEAQLAQRTSELQFQLKELKEQSQKYKREEEVREQKLKEQIKKEFVDELQSKDAKYKNLYKYFQDFTIVLGKDLNHYITHIKDEKFVHLKKNLQNVVKEFQTGQNALHEVNNQILQNENDQKAYEIPKEKDYYQEQLVKKNEYKQYANQEIDTIILKLQTLQKDYQQIYLDNLQNQQLQSENNNNNPKQISIINNNNNNNQNQNLNINNEQGEFYITQQPSNQQLHQQQQQQQIQQQMQQQNLNASVENNKNQNQNNNQNKINQNLYTADDVYWKLNLHERVALENGEFAELYAKFQKLRFYYIYREAKIRKKYEDKIKLIQNQNSSNEELFRKIQELTNQNEQMIQEILQHKKTMSIMEYQNQVLRLNLLNYNNIQ